MKIVDVNVLIDATNDMSQHHAPPPSWIGGCSAPT